MAGTEAGRGAARGSQQQQQQRLVSEMRQRLLLSPLEEQAAAAAARRVISNRQRPCLVSYVSCSKQQRLQRVQPGACRCPSSSRCCRL
jgi:hypothetical protein